MSEISQTSTMYRDQFERLQQANSVPAWLRQVREENFSNYEKLGLPSKRDERWRFFDLGPIVSQEFRLSEPDKNSVDDDEIIYHLFGVSDCYILVFANGRFVSSKSRVSKGEQGIIIDNIGNELSNNSK